MRKRLSLALAITAGFWAGTAQAHELKCEKTVNGEHIIAVDTFPVDLNYHFVVTNQFPDQASLFKSYSDVIVDPGFTVPQEIPGGGSVTADKTITLQDFAACQALANTTVNGNPAIDNSLTVRTDINEFTCRARVICEQAPCGITRTIGFFKTHCGAADACLASGPITIDGFTINNGADLQALLSTTPSTCSTIAEQDVLILARQLAGAICNERLFGTTTPFIQQAETALSTGTTSCSDLLALAQELDTFNNSGESCTTSTGPSNATSFTGPGSVCQSSSTQTTTNFCTGSCQ